MQALRATGMTVAFAGAPVVIVREGPGVGRAVRFARALYEAGVDALPALGRDARGQKRASCRRANETP